MANDPIQQMLNNMLKKHMNDINSQIYWKITGSNLDPWGQVASGNDSLGSIDLGICTATAGANYSVTNMRGLNAFQFDTIEVTSAQGGPDDSVTGDFTATISTGQYDITTALSGGVYAGCGILKVHPSISGNATVTNLSATATGFFKANTKSGKLTITEVSMTNMSVSYGSLSVEPSSLGILDPLLGPLVTAITNLFNGDIKGDISSAAMPAINGIIADNLPISENIS